MTRAGFTVAAGSVGWLSALLMQVLLVCLMRPGQRWLDGRDVPALLVLGLAWWSFLVVTAWWFARFVRPAGVRPSPLRVASAIAVSLGVTVAVLFVLVKGLAPEMAQALGPAVPLGFFAPQLVAAWAGAWLAARPAGRSAVEWPAVDQR